MDIESLDWPLGLHDWCHEEEVIRQCFVQFQWPMQNLHRLGLSTMLPQCLGLIVVVHQCKAVGDQVFRHVDRVYPSRGRACYKDCFVALVRLYFICRRLLEKRH